MSPRALAFLIAASFTGLIYAVTRISGYGSLIQGIDSGPSTSKAQWWIRTAVITFGYVAVFVERWLRGDPSSGLDVPQNLPLVMGFSVTTLISAKAVTGAQVAWGLIDKTTTSTGLGGILTDLGKIQYVAVTVIAVGVYVVCLATQCDTRTLPVWPTSPPRSCS